MKKSTLAALLFPGALAGCSTTGGGHVKSLFNGRDLTGWVAMYGGESKSRGTASKPSTTKPTA
jgi:hypothetical protein